MNSESRREGSFIPKHARIQLVNRLREKGIRNLEVLSALENVPRDMFLDQTLMNQSYDDVPLPIGYQQTISQPFIVALMSEKLICGSTNRKAVLEIGTGCGYQTAILSYLYSYVCSIERIQPLHERAKHTLNTLRIKNVELRYGDGREGWGEESTFDSIILTAAPKTIPNAILTQLASGGCLVAPVGQPMNQKLTVIRNRADRLYEEKSEAVRFVPLMAGTRT